MLGNPNQDIQLILVRVPKLKLQQPEQLEQLEQSEQLDQQAKQLQ